MENLNHLKRILLSSTYLSALGSDSNTRRTPAEMSGNTMSSLLEYLLELIVAPQGGAHQLAMEFFHALVSRTGTQPREAILSKFGSFQDFLNKLEARICKIEEPSLQGGFLSVEIAKDFQAFYETYFWLIGKRFISILLSVLYRNFLPIIFIIIMVSDSLQLDFLDFLNFAYILI